MATPSSSPENTDAAHRLGAVRSRIAAAAARASRDAGDILLLAVSKGQTAAAVAALADFGQRHFGENYLQEGLSKIETLRQTRPQTPGLVWHFIGQLQSNKTRDVAEHFDWVHTVDRAKLVERLSSQRPFHAPPLEVCVQVKLGEEASKGGVSPTDLPALLEAVDAAPRLRLRGLMALPPAEIEEARQRRWFAELRHLYDRARLHHPTLDTLSMGMSADLEAAILEGSSLVRVGTALFGERLQSMP